MIGLDAMQGLLHVQQYEALAAPKQAALIIKVAQTPHPGHQASLRGIVPDNEL